MTKSNVNPDHYKTAGRERQGEDIVQEIHKAERDCRDAGVDQRVGAQGIVS